MLRTVNKTGAYRVGKYEVYLNREALPGQIVGWLPGTGDVSRA